MNLNKLAREITLEEGLSKSLSIAQVKEVLKITLKRLAHVELADLVNLFKKYE